MKRILTVSAVGGIFLLAGLWYYALSERFYVIIENRSPHILREVEVIELRRHEVQHLGNLGPGEIRAVRFRVGEAGVSLTFRTPSNSLKRWEDGYSVRDEVMLLSIDKEDNVILASDILR